MKLAIVSGKGGTGKTTMATSLALCAPGPAAFLDCDVEEPNGHIYLAPDLTDRHPVSLTVPSVVGARCDHCGKCMEICRFNAMAVFPNGALTFPELCHACGGCFLVCPHEALAKARREVGVVEKGRARDIAFVRGRLRIGEAMASPLIRAVLREAPKEGLVILDAPPGTSCPVVTTLREADFAIAVTEPTPFGLHDLKLLVELLRAMAIPFGVIVNRENLGDAGVEEWCGTQEIPVFLKVPFDRTIAADGARGVPLAVSRPDLQSAFRAVLDRCAP